jgi:tetratricopeptide (TPR) repeat protein
MLNQAKADLAVRNYAAAQRAAETVLAGITLPALRAQALLVAGEAAYGMGSYGQAAQRYGEFLAKNGHDPEAPQAALTLGWAEARLGQFDRAQQTWSRISRVFPDDERAHLGLLLSAHAAVQSGNLAGARRWLDDLVKRYPVSSSATVGRLSRSIIAVRTGHEKDAAPDLRELIRTRQLCAAKERQSLLRELTRGGADAPLIRVNGHDCQPLAAGSPTLQQFAAPFLTGAGDPETTPAVLHALVRLGTEERLWTDVRVLSTDLLKEYPSYPSIPTLLAGVANQAAVDREWPVVRATYEQLLASYPGSPLKPTARLDFAESLLRTGDPARAQAQIAQVASADRSREDAPRRLFLQGQVYETLGRPREALAAYEELRRDHPRSEWTAESQLPRARVMQEVGQRRQARALLEHILKGAQGDVYSEAAVRLAENLEAEGQHAAAVKWFLTAAYLDPESAWGQRAQLGAVEGLIATGDRAAADAIYRRMEASNATDPSLLSKARDALDGRGRGR